MITELTYYLDRLKSRLRLNPSQERDFLYEVYTHLEERIQEFRESGLSEEESVEKAVQSLGPVNAIARQMNQLHSGGSWREALLAAAPHVLFAFVFAFHLWSNALWLIVSLGSVFGIVAYGWWHNRPVWLFSWLSYSLVPLLMLGLFLLSLLGQSLALLPGNEVLSYWWAWAALFIYAPVALWMLVSIGIQTVKRDWLLGSLVTLPLPALVGWLLVLPRKGTFLEDSTQRLYDLSPAITWNFLIMAIMVALFIRVRQRYLKTSVLMTAGLLILALLAHSSRLGFPSVMLLALVTLGLLLGPALLERKIGHGESLGENYVLLRPSSRMRQGT